MRHLHWKPPSVLTHSWWQPCASVAHSSNSAADHRHHHHHHHHHSRHHHHHQSISQSINRYRVSVCENTGWNPRRAWIFSVISWRPFLVVILQKVHLRGSFSPLPSPSWCDPSFTPFTTTWGPFTNVTPPLRSEEGGSRMACADSGWVRLSAVLSLYQTLRKYGGTLANF